jgi:hypothetical protein
MDRVCNGIDEGRNTWRLGSEADPGGRTEELGALGEIDFNLVALNFQGGRPLLGFDSC